MWIPASLIETAAPELLRDYAQSARSAQPGLAHVPSPTHGVEFAMASDAPAGAGVPGPSGLPGASDAAAVIVLDDEDESPSAHGAAAHSSTNAADEVLVISDDMKILQATIDLT